jgi:hypothetical protein
MKKAGARRQREAVEDMVVVEVVLNQRAAEIL